MDKNVIKKRLARLKNYTTLNLSKNILTPVKLGKRLQTKKPIHRIPSSTMLSSLLYSEQ